MAEGAQLPWKIQKLNVAPTLSYDNIHKPLRAPKGKRWNFDPVDKEWSLVKTESPCCIVDVDAVVITEGTNIDGASVATTRKINDDPLALYVEHYITPSDTFQGICLRYKITPMELRRANFFTGENLKLVPNPLKIPRRDVIAERVITNGPRSMTQSELTGVLLKECQGMKRTEATAYLMLSDWDLAEALENAREDGF
jgi:hypothetical protein